MKQILTLFHSTGLFLFLLKPSESQRCSDVFRGIEKDQWYAMDQWKGLADVHFIVLPVEMVLIANIFTSVKQKQRDLSLS